MREYREFLSTKRLSWTLSEAEWAGVFDAVEGRDPETEVAWPASYMEAYRSVSSVRS